ncbi:MAG: hypothetical protein AAGK02_15535 [Pseudomonadota bacterium]
MPRLDLNSERECLQLLEEALAQPPDQRRLWLERKLRERDQIERKLEDLLAIAEHNDIRL